MATIIAAHDLSGVGRCSLTTALAVLPALGHTCYPLPTAVLSQQTGLPGYSFLNFTPYLPDFLDGWRGLDISPDIIYTGFLGDGEQASLLCGFIESHPLATVVVDPVMGDGGSLYACYDGTFVEQMKLLSCKADILLPNQTEFNLLTGMSAFPGKNEDLLEAALSIASLKLKYIVITSACRPRGMCNIIIDIKRRSLIEVFYSNNGISYNGAGDLFASVVCGAAACGLPFESSVRAASGFVAAAVALTPPESDPRLGVNYEPLLRKIYEYFPA